MADFIASLVVTVLMLAVYHWYAKRTPVDKRMTWGEAMITSTYVFAVFFWVYGVVPHYWLEWADKGLEWRADRLFQGPHIPGISNSVTDPVTQEVTNLGVIADQGSGGWFPFAIPYLVLRDLIAVAIYGVVLGGNIWYWIHWQTRDKRAAEAEQRLDEPSEFGRPLIREGAR